MPVVVIVEPDSLPNLATNLENPRCGGAATQEAYEQGVAHAIERRPYAAIRTIVWRLCLEGGVRCPSRPGASLRGSCEGSSRLCPTNHAPLMRRSCATHAPLSRAPHMRRSRVRRTCAARAPALMAHAPLLVCVPLLRVRWRLACARAPTELHQHAPHAAVYLDAGHGGWLGWAPQAAKYAAVVQRLHAPGAESHAYVHLRGFATNVAK